MTADIHDMIAYPRRSIEISMDCFKRVFQLIICGKLQNGPSIEIFEKRFAEYIGGKGAIGVSSAQFGLYLILKYFNFGEGSEIILASYNFYAIPMILKMFGIKPVFIDIDPSTYNINSSLVEEYITEKTKAIIITHMYGNPCNMELILNLCRKKKLVLIEDCAHACGASYKNKRVGSFGDVAIFSFALGKNMPCFGGGMIVVNKENLLKDLKNLAKRYPYPSQFQLIKNLIIVSTAYILTNKFIFSIFMYPFIRLLNILRLDFLDSTAGCKVMFQFPKRNKRRLSNLQAAIGIIQLNRIDTVNLRLKHNAEKLNSLLQSANNIKVPLHNPDSNNIYLYYRIRVKKRDSIIKKLLNQGIVTQKDNMSNCSEMGIFNNRRSDCRYALEISREIVEIPNGTILSEKDLRYIAQKVTEAATN